MRTVRFHQYGGPDTLRVDEVPDPVPAAGELLIRVEAAGIGFADLQLRSGALRAWAPGLPLPYNPGHEAVGTVVDAGAATALIGTRVMVVSPAGGAYADLLTVPEAAVVPLPDGVDAHHALALLGQGTTAVGVLDKAGVAPGERVLVEAATGGVGSLLVQLAKHAGAEVIAAVHGEAKAAVARDLGADAIADLTDPEWAAGVGPVHAVLESIGGPVTRTALGLLQPSVGRMVVYGDLSGLPHAIDTETVYLRALSVLGFATALMPPERLAPLRDRAFALAATGTLKPLIGSTRPLTEAAAAHTAIESRTTIGKNTLVP
ncbi:NADPH2:quinone reductase [Actinocorallia herbida]|uniref:NADPH2:quinone reductase n=1 Tax=Actinocorallia herbida TaxID=58109 RepID=A0A3N1CZJ3_9ACTN|nr:zinc-binding dehydrogenase [Actinocorallia herbida]ROO86672.1 NADPH2:quinone reductase [Actinocorallia herbida]